MEKKKFDTTNYINYETYRNENIKNIFIQLKEIILNAFNGFWPRISKRHSLLSSCSTSSGYISGLVLFDLLCLYPVTSFVIGENNGVCGAILFVSCIVILPQRLEINSLVIVSLHPKNNWLSQLPTMVSALSL